MSSSWANSAPYLKFTKMFKRIPKNLKILRINSLYKYKEELKELIKDKLRIAND